MENYLYLCRVKRLLVEKINRHIANRITGRLIMWMVVLLLVFSCVFYHFGARNIIRFYAGQYHDRMLISYESTRRIISDVYVSVTSNLPYLEQSLDHPEGYQDTMKRIVSQGNRIHSCGINFIEDYYPKRGSQFHPFAWRRTDNPDEILTKEEDDDSDFLNADWFLSTIKSDKARWMEPVIDDDDKNTALTAYIVPIHDASGKAVGVLRAGISLEWLANKLSHTGNKYNTPSLSVPNIFEAESNLYLIDSSGRFLTQPNEDKPLEGTFFSHLKQLGNYDIELFIEKMETGKTSMNESEVKYLFDDEECYLFFTPVKYTDWMMVTVVPCQPVDHVGLFYCLHVTLLVMLLMLVLILINYIYLKSRNS